MATNPSHDGTPRLDEAMFQKLLAAAYVIQEHRNQTDLQLREQSDNPGAVDAEYATTLAEIVETQHQILLRHLDLDAAAALVVEQLKKITSASGAAVCLLDHDHLVYRAVSGMAAAEMGQALPRGQSLSAVVVSDGIVLRCADVLTESQVDPLVAQRARVGSFIAVPIFHDDEVAGALELVFAKAHGYQEHDIRTCQLMAGLVTEGLTRSVDAEWKRNLAAERDSMLEALEKLKPQLDRLAKDAQALSASAGPARPRAAAPPGPAMDESVLKPDVVKAKVTKPSVLASKARSVAGTATEACHRCGHQVAVEDVYCGNCGSLRSERSRAESTPGSSVNSWDAPQSLGNASSATSPLDRAQDRRASFSTNLVDHEMELPNEILAMAKDEPADEPEQDVGADLMKLLPPDPDGPAYETPMTAASPASHAPVAAGLRQASAASQPADSYPWTSAANARAWLNTIADPKSDSGMGGLLKTHRGDLSLGAAILALLMALFWGITNHRSSAAAPAAAATTPAQAAPADTGVSNAQTPVPARPRRKTSEPQPELSLTERALVALGLAEAPPPPAQYEGNPDVTVWVDLRTALYYCPNAELYGRTPKGKYLTQREAQIDQFEPASRKVCE